MCNNDNDSCKQIAEILAIISVLQQNACNSDTCLDSCDRGFLGCGSNSLTCNTRPIMLYLCNGQSLSLPIEKDSTDCSGAGCSNVFRVEKLDGCCCTFRVLAPNTEGGYSATNSFFTINLHCVCCIRCLSDTFIDCI